MEQESLFHEDIYDALRTVVSACGGFKRVGADLFPELGPAKGGERLAACLNRERREQLNPEQILYLLNKGREEGCHAGTYFICDACDYERPRPLEPEDEQAKLQREYIQAVRALEKITKRQEHMAQLKAVG